MVNAHTHIYSALAPLLPAPTPAPRTFAEALQQIWWRLDRAMDLPALRIAARYYVVNALACGTTALVDHHESPECIEGSLDVLADACQELGLPAVLCYGATERNSGITEARRGLAECRRFILDNRRPLVRGSVGLHASFTVSDDTIREAGALCRELRTVLHVHVAEDAIDVDDARARGFVGPLERLDRLDALPAGSILAHGVHLDARQVQRAAALGCWLVQNPRSNDHNGVGYPMAIRNAPLVALGTDGFPSDLAVEREALRAIGEAHGEIRSVLDARLDNGARLASERFAGRLPRAAAPPAGATIEDICGEARHQAQRVAARMGGTSARWVL
jgi:cytosine/adenosine deaminase-related metal-dependent hydrolase